MKREEILHIMDITKPPELGPRDDRGRFVCPMAFLESDAVDAMRLEVEASEYGRYPRTNLESDLFLTVRAARMTAHDTIDKMTPRGK
ncbi:MAG: hypothetical protein KC729_00135 [Candidatus Eisenbacteria bacterium]|uniref:Uncharacterized protein n=1 Tax=Eiseniibacteriota bacterium TaxID=2212470 RepID=A0A956RMH3_UNCEI|nr:hypothetical protein [Candidatus Eisenbacteria bacterium]